MIFGRQKGKVNASSIIDQLGVLSEKLKQAVSEIDNITKDIQTENEQRDKMFKNLHHGRS